MRAFLVAIVIVSLSLACGSQSGRRDQEAKLRIGTFSRAIDYAPYYIARHFDWFGDPGSEVEFIEFGDRDSIGAAFAAGDLEVLFAAAPPVIVTEAQGVDLGVVEISCTLQQEIVARRNLPISTVSDLRGQDVAVLLATSSHYGLLRALESVGLSSRDINLLDMGPDTAEPAFESGEIDAWAVWPPFVEKQILNGRGKVISGGDAIIQSIVAMDAAFIRESPERAREITSAVRRAKDWILHNPSEAQVIVAKELGLPSEVVQLAWGKHDWSARLSDALAQDLARKADFLNEQGVLRRRVEVASDLLSDDLGGGSPLQE